jgi:hypothetical protein
MDLLSPLPISLRQLQYIVAVAELGSFRRAVDDGHCFRDQALQLCAGAGAKEAGFRAISLAPRLGPSRPTRPHRRNHSRVI